MPIKCSPFGRIELSRKDAERFIRHMHEDKPNLQRLHHLERGRKAVKEMA